MVIIKPLLFKIVLLLVLICPLTTGAYVLQGLHLLDRMAKSIGQPGKIRIQQEVTLYDASDETGETVFSETLHFQPPGKFRSETVFQDTSRILLVSGSSSLVIVNQKQKAEKQSRYDLYKDLLFLRPRSILEYNLARNGVDASISSFGRLDDQPVYIVGAKYPDLSTPQIWLDKETFRPLRWIVEGGDKRLEFVYTDWQEAGSMWYPAGIRFIENERITRSIQVLEIDTTPAFPADFFDIEFMKSIFPLESAEAENDPASETMEEVHQEIEDFNRSLE